MAREQRQISLSFSEFLMVAATWALFAAGMKDIIVALNRIAAAIEALR